MMKYLILAFVFIAYPVLGQDDPAMGDPKEGNLGDKAEHSSDPNSSYNGIGGSIGASIFKGKPYLLVGFNPQFEFGKWGIGIDGAIRISNKGTLRKEDFDEVYDIARFLNFIRFNKPYDDFYFRIGGLRNATIGHGAIVDNYSNNSSYDDRRIGAAARLDLGLFGGEGLLSDIFARGFYAGRGFARPLRLLPIGGGSWFMRNVEVGATMSFDFDPDALRIIPNHEPWVKHFIDTVDGKARDSLVIIKDSASIASPMNMYGVDVSVMVWQDRNAEGRVYADYVNIVDFNHGYLFGVRSSFYTAENTFFDIRVERYLFTNYFLPNYYNSFYERDKYNDDVSQLDYITKASRLVDTNAGAGNGSRFGFFTRFDRTLEFSLTYAHLDNIPRADLMEMVFTFPEIWWKFFGSITYNRRNIDGPKDYFKFDENTIAGARLSVAPFKFITLSLLARWTFTRDPDTKRVSSQGIIEPKVTFIARL
jgi:hypothetical protein